MDKLFANWNCVSSVNELRVRHWVGDLIRSVFLGPVASEILSSSSGMDSLKEIIGSKGAKSTILYYLYLVKDGISNTLDGLSGDEKEKIKTKIQEKLLGLLHILCVEPSSPPDPVEDVQNIIGRYEEFLNKLDGSTTREIMLDVVRIFCSIFSVKRTIYKLAMIKAIGGFAMDLLEERLGRMRRFMRDSVLSILAGVSGIYKMKMENGENMLSISISRDALSDYLSLFSALSTAIPMGKAFNPAWFIRRMLGEELRGEVAQEYEGSFEKFLEKLEKHYTNIHSYLTGDRDKIKGEEAVILNIARELGLEEIIRRESTFRNFKKKTAAMLTELKNGLTKFLEGNEARISRTLLGKALGNIVESKSSPAITFTASHAYANAHQIWIAEETITLIRTTKEKNREKIKKLVDEIITGDTKKKLNELRGILETIMADGEECRDARYAASRLLDAINNDDSIVLEHIMLLTKATLMVEKIMEELASGEVSRETIEEAEKVLSGAILSQIEITQNENEVLIKEKNKKGEKTLAQIKMTKTGEGEGYISFYYKNPVTKASLELMMERTGKQTDIMGYEWVGWNLLPIYGGEMISVVDGKPCFQKYDRSEGGLALRRTITYHSLFTLAEYFDAIMSTGEKKYAFQYARNALKKVKEKLGELQMWRKELSDITRKIEKMRKGGEDAKKIRELEKANKMISEESTPTMFRDMESLGPLEAYYKKNLINKLNKIKELVDNGRTQKALNRIDEMLADATILETKIGTEKEKANKIKELIKKALTSKEAAEEALQELVQMIDDPQDKEENNKQNQKAKNIIIEAITYILLLQQINPEILQQLKPTMKQDIKQQLRTGLIVGLMSTLGSITAYIIMTGLLARGNTAILDMLNFTLSTLAWIIIGAAITILTVCLLKKGFIGKGKAIALSVSMSIGIWSYARKEKLGITGDMPFFTPLSGILWVWDEFDDFQDGYNRLKNKQEKPDIMDTLELWLLPVILGMFGTWMGIDQRVVATKIPGRWGFARYASEANIPSPWDVVVNAVYEILAFLLANVIASGARGLGWIVYTIGSVLGSILMNTLLGSVFSLIFS